MAQQEMTTRVLVVSEDPYLHRGGESSDGVSRGSRRGHVMVRPLPASAERSCLLLPVASGEDAYAAAERLRRSVASVRMRVASGDVVTITVSVGAASTADLGPLEPERLY